MKRILLCIFSLLVISLIRPVYSQTDSASVTLHTWKLDDHLNKIITEPYDTSLNRFHLKNRAYLKSYSNTYLGNLGSPIMPNPFFLRKNYREFIFLTYYLPYTRQPESTKYFNTKKPFTEIAYSSAGNKTNQEQTLQLIHTQNVNENFNVGILFDLISSEGQYVNQKTAHKSLSFFTSYLLPRYSLHANANYNILKMNENGGIIIDDDLFESNPQEITVNLNETLNKASSKLANSSIMVAQKLSFIRRPDTTGTRKRQFIAPSISHSLHYSRNNRVYNDNLPGSGFYQNTYVDALTTYDSISYRVLENSLNFEFITDTTRKVSFLGRVGIKNQLVRYGTIIPEDTAVVVNPPTIINIPGAQITIFNNDTTFSNARIEDFSNSSLTFYALNQLTEYINWDAAGELFFSGYKAGDLKLTGKVNINLPFRKNPVVLQGGLYLENRKPDYFLTRYNSNNFEWNMSFGNTTTTRIDSRVSLPASKMSLGANYALLDNHVYFDTTAMPAQENEPFSVFAAFLKKDFELGRFRMHNRIDLQISSKEDVLPLPLLGASLSAFFDHRIQFKLTGGTLYYQIGLDIYYHTPFFGSAYMPATGVFYNQVERKIGNYPYLDLFLNLKLKRTRFFLKYEHVTSGLLNLDYFNALHYPMNQRMLKFGLSWTFYD